MKVASDVVLVNTGDWTQVYIDGKNSEYGGHSLSDYDWARVIAQAQPIESIIQREFLMKPDDEYWPYLHDWPENLSDIPESELQEPQWLLENQGLKLPDAVGGYAKLI
jgi:hypothetical protein